ncbi:hypothetical protein MRX96_026698 [Rhipicephalus microplus]
MVTSPSSTVSVGGTESSGTGVQISVHAKVVGSYPRKAEAAVCGCSRGEVPTQSAFGCNARSGERSSHERQHDILALGAGTLLDLHHDCGGRGGLNDFGLSANHQSDNTVTSAEPKSSYDSANHASNNDTNHASTDGSSSDNTYNDNIHRNASCGYRKHYYHA